MSECVRVRESVCVRVCVRERVCICARERVGRERVRPHEYPKMHGAGASGYLPQFVGAVVVT